MQADKPPARGHIRLWFFHKINLLINSNYTKIIKAKIMKQKLFESLSEMKFFDNFSNFPSFRKSPKGGVLIILVCLYKKNSPRKSIEWKILKLFDFERAQMQRSKQKIPSVKIKICLVVNRAQTFSDFFEKSHQLWSHLLGFFRGLGNLEKY